MGFGQIIYEFFIQNYIFSFVTKLLELKRHIESRTIMPGVIGDSKPRVVTQQVCDIIKVSQIWQCQCRLSYYFPLILA
jgi:hypothetical protein